ncbi:vanomycin resistance protein VanB [Clostridium sp. P21]|uniref:Vanomycin resistance protein VanB n=1 Tax=Clostridium muellerianum TaxID=2716538 RepID=A0A7Y0EHS8_9CLOT|nr:VanW family protein [Clostridium muellerianum]NMM63716.1 vanomycin resistance protein VanB [Clostridium muellerianum]
MIENENNKEKTIKKPKIKVNRKKMTRSLCILVVLFYIMRISWIHFWVNKYDKLIYPGVKVEGIKLNGKTKEEAVNTLKRNYVNEIFKKNIVIKVQDKSYTINYSKLNINYNIEDTVKDAFKYGKDKSTHDKYKAIRSSEEKNFSLKYKYDKKEIEETISKIQQQFDKKPVDAKITKNKDDDFKITSEKYGQEVDKDKLIKDIDEGISNKAIKDIVVNASLKKVQPSTKKSDLEKIDTKISSFTTNFSSSSDSRINNINISAKALDGTTIMPKGKFSFNNIVGERTEKKGYKAATIIVGDKLESGLGGGVCQVSSTLHNAVVRAGITPTERDHHNMPVSYVGLGMDATVDYGNIDYKFKNTLDYPIYIECVVKDKDITFNIFSNSKLTKKTYDLVNNVKTVSKAGKTICTVKAYKVTYVDGKEVSRQEINSDDYAK